MDWLTFIAEMTKAVAWPLALTLIVLALKKEFRQKLRELARLKHGETELEFGKELAQAEVEAAKPAMKEPEPKVLPAPQETIPELEKYVEIAKRSIMECIIKAYEEVERPMMLLYYQHHGLKRPRNLEAFADELVKEGLLSVAGRAVLRHLRNLRNNAAHNVAQTLSEQEAVTYAKLALQIGNTLDRLATIRSLQNKQAADAGITSRETTR